MEDIDLYKGQQRLRFREAEDANACMTGAAEIAGNFLRLLTGSQRERFKLVLESAEASRFIYEPRFALTALWVGPEALFSIGFGETTFRITAAWASYMEGRGDNRIQLQQRLKKLYDYRSKAVHGSTVSMADLDGAYAETFYRLMQCLWKAASSGHLPTAKQFQDGILN